MGKEGQFLIVRKISNTVTWVYSSQIFLNQQMYLFGSVVSVINWRTSWLHVRTAWKTRWKLFSHFALCSRKMAFIYLRGTKINMYCHSRGDLALVSYSSATKVCTRRCSLVLCWVHDFMGGVLHGLETTVGLTTYVCVKSCRSCPFNFFDVLSSKIQASWICMDKKYFGIWTCRNQ